jgi:hypothetical protein
MRAVRASPGITRIKPNTMSEDSTRTGMDRASRRAMYLYTRPPPVLAYLSIQRRASVDAP